MGKCEILEFQNLVLLSNSVFCFTDSLSGFSLRVRGRVRVSVGVGGNFRVSVRASVRLGEGWVLYMSTRIYSN